MSGAVARLSRSQPSVTAAVRRLRASSSASIATRCVTSSSRRSAAWTAGSRLSPEAVARCSISTTARIAAFLSAGVGVEQVARDARQRVARRQARERVERRPAQQLVVEQLHERGRGARVADLAERVERRVLQPRLTAQRLDEPRHGRLGADLPEAGGRGVAHVGVGVGERRHQPGHRGLVLDRAEHHAGEEPHLLVGIDRERSSGATAEAPSRT